MASGSFGDLEWREYSYRSMRKLTKEHCRNMSLGRTKVKYKHRIRCKRCKDMFEYTSTFKIIKRFYCDRCHYKIKSLDNLKRYYAKKAKK